VPGYRAKKRLGQNFLKTRSVIDRVIAELDLKARDTVVEIGPGRGALTLPLAESGATVCAVEFDRDLQGYLQALMKTYPRVEILAQDFLTFTPDQLKADRFKLIGNLPYNITSPVVDWCLKYRDRIEIAVLMVQKELGERLAAEPGSRDWSPLSIFTRLGFEVEARFEVAPKHFRPAPQVTSTVLRLTPRAKSTPIGPEFDRVVRAAFKQRRKQLVNNLVVGLSAAPESIREVLEKLLLDPKARAESLTIDQFLQLTETLVTCKLV
jgi:16S rRNA (adenine1518-N6/adenine1519-N6)-dimethyltransferase